MALLIGIFAVTAQNGTISPYSRYGYGLLNDNTTSSQRAMGGVGYAMNSGRQINVKNPASYAAIDSLTFLFDMGVSMTSLWSEEGAAKEQKFGGGLDYITMQFPLGKYMGGSVGVLPYSSVGYAFGSKIDNGSSSREGAGSINLLYAGVAGRPFKGFTIGANIAYMFGSTINDSYATTVSGSTALFEREIQVRDWYLDLGVQYGFNVSHRNRITLGVTYSPGKDLHGHSYLYTYEYSSNENLKPETTEDYKLKGLYSIPMTVGAGINFSHDNRIMAEIDFTYQPWSKAKYRNIDNTDETSPLANRYRLGAGVEFTPDPRGSYFRRVKYRAGLYGNRDYLIVMGNNVRECGASVGLGFPVPSFKTIVNVGFEWRRRQAHPNPLIKENYLGITVGVNFNELWFFKSKIY